MRKLIVNVDISGTAGSGKTTIAYIIEKALADYDLYANHRFVKNDSYDEVVKNFIDNDIKHTTNVEDFVKLKVDEIKKKSEICITINEHQLSRPLKVNSAE